MIGLDTSRIEVSVSREINEQAHVIVHGVGTGAAACESLARFGIGAITAIDGDTVGRENAVRQHFSQDQIGMKKVDALGENLHKINPNIQYRGLSKMTYELSEQEQAELYSNASILLNMTDSFQPQIFGAEQCQRWEIPGVWSGYYELSRCFEGVFYIPGQSSCYCCAVQPRLKAQAEAPEEIKVPSDGNTSGHVFVGDGIVVMLTMAMLHNHTQGYEFSNWFGRGWVEYNLLQTKLHPAYSSHEGSLFERNFGHSASGAKPFQTLWRKTAVHEPPMYEQCPVCAKMEQGKSAKSSKNSNDK